MALGAIFVEFVAAVVFLAYFTLSCWSFFVEFLVEESFFLGLVLVLFCHFFTTIMISHNNPTNSRVAVIVNKSEKVKLLIHG